MKRALLCLISLSLFPFAGFAQSSKKKQADPSFFYYTRGNARSMQSVLPKGDSYRVYTRKDQVREERAHGHVMPSERNALFRKVGIDTKTHKMDELDKDMLLLSAREYTIGELRSDYPMFSEKQLRALQVEARKIK